MIGTVVTILMTLALFSFIYKENPVFRWAEHVYIGAAAGYGFVLAVEFIKNSGWGPLVGGKVGYVIPFILGLMLYCRFKPEAFWAYRIPIALLTGTGTGLAMRSIVESQFIEQIKATMLPLNTGDALQNLNNLVMVVMVITALSYFIFSLEHKGVLGTSAKIGRYVMMAAFGAGFGMTVTFRFSLFTGRMIYLLEPENRPTTAGVLIAIIAVILAIERWKKR